MRTLDDHLIELYTKGIISYDSAMATAYDPAQFALQASQTQVATSPAGAGKKRLNLFGGR